MEGRGQSYTSKAALLGACCVDTKPTVSGVSLERARDGDVQHASPSAGNARNTQVTATALTRAAVCTLWSAGAGRKRRSHMPMTTEG